MPLGILNNIPSLAAENQLTLTNNALSATLEQLSSGSRINTGADDAAGLAIANGLQANITALTQSVSNANNGVGELQLADGALAQVSNLLNRAVTLATESATGTVSDSQRTALQAEYSSILDEINRIGSATTYNGRAVFQSSAGSNLNEVVSNGGATTALTVATALTNGDTTSFSAGGKTFTFTAGATSTVGDLISAIDNPNTDPAGLQAYIATTGPNTGELVVTDSENNNDLTVQAADPALGQFSNPALQNLNQLASNSGTALTPETALTDGHVTSFSAGGQTFAFTAGDASTVADLIQAINNPSTDPAGLQAYIATSGAEAGQLIITDPNNNGDLAVVGTVDAALGTAFANTPPTAASGTTNIFLSDSTVEGSSTIAVTIGGLSASAITNGSGGNAIDLSVTDLSTQSDAQTALTAINSAIANVASVRGTLGASVNRLTAASNVINSQLQNLTSAENTITAADIPSAVANLTKYSILEQTGIAALAQANQQQQLVLKLLQ